MNGRNVKINRLPKLRGFRSAKDYELKLLEGWVG